MTTRNFDPEKLRAKYNPQGSQTWRIQCRMLHMLEVIDAICQRHGIPYWLSGGSMLGAVRHKGFIPWDDDLDLELLRPDFLRLMQILPKELPADMRLQWHTTDSNYFFQFAKVRDTRSHIRENNGYDRVFRERGIFVDIFPLECQPRWVHRLSNLCFGHSYKMLRTASDPLAAMRGVRLWVGLCRRVVFPVLRLFGKLSASRFYDFGLGIPFYQRSLLTDFLPVRRVPFEHLSAPVMNAAEKCLAYRYGDYLRLPEHPGAQYHAEEVSIED